VVVVVVVVMMMMNDDDDDDDDDKYFDADNNNDDCCSFVVTCFDVVCRGTGARGASSGHQLYQPADARVLEHSRGTGDGDFCDVIGDCDCDGGVAGDGCHAVDGFWPRQRPANDHEDAGCACAAGQEGDGARACVTS
jgi:hypothetical protein